jgi:hypothetical protein
VSSIGLWPGGPSVGLEAFELEAAPEISGFGLFSLDELFISTNQPFNPINLSPP